MRRVKRMLSFVCLILLLLLVFISCKSNTLESPEEEKPFPLSIDLTKYRYTVGETLRFTATITNQSGKDVSVVSNGEMPCVNFREADCTIEHAEIAMAKSRH